MNHLTTLRRALTVAATVGGPLAFLIIETAGKNYP
jgi:hypothetical protein